MARRFPFVLDTTILSNFSHVERPRIISAVTLGHVLATPTIMSELSVGISLGFVPRCDWTWLETADLNSFWLFAWKF